MAGYLYGKSKIESLPHIILVYQLQVDQGCKVKANIILSCRRKFLEIL